MSLSLSLYKLSEISCWNYLLYLRFHTAKIAEEACGWHDSKSALVISLILKPLTCISVSRAGTWYLRRAILEASEQGSAARRGNVYSGWEPVASVPQRPGTYHELSAYIQRIRQLCLDSSPIISEVGFLHLCPRCGNDQLLRILIT